MPGYTQEYKMGSDSTGVIPLPAFPLKVCQLCNREVGPQLPTTAIVDSSSPYLRVELLSHEGEHSVFVPSKSAMFAAHQP